MAYRILITGSSGLVGTALRAALRARGTQIAGLDIRATGPDAGDIRDAARVRSALDRCDGIVHLAAISRVHWSEDAPDLCWSTNVGGLRTVLDATHHSERAAWVVFASSREVYGQPACLPVLEDSPLRPVNVYGRSKLAGEELVETARRAGLRASTLRLSNVYGTVHDHADRVVPAFARGAVLGRALRVDGADRSFDFVHLDDTVRGILSLIEHLAGGGEPPAPIHLCTGQAVPLASLATMAAEVAGSGSRLRIAPARTFDVERFCGSPERARALLGWTPRVTLREGLTRLIHDFRAELGTSSQGATAP